jgi:hypothetical protein
MARYWKTTLTVVILHEDDEPVIYDSISDLERVAYEVNEGDASGQVTSAVLEEVTEERMAQLLEEQGSDPSFLIMPQDDDDNEEEVQYLNHYRCSHDDPNRSGYGKPVEEWSSSWSCMCNDKCPVCNAETEPYKSEDLSEEQPEDANHNRIGLGVVSCRFCGKLDCNFDCDESKAGGFNQPEQATQ